jgi:Ca2+-binding EF-hand superfamily protein
MSDFATQLLTQITSAGTNSGSVDQAILNRFNAGASGSISQAQFQQVFAEMMLDQPAQLNADLQPTSFNIHKTIFECMLYPSYSNNYATAKYQASEMMTALDKNGDGAVTTAELQAYGGKSASSSATSSSPSTSSASTTSTTSSTSTTPAPSSSTPSTPPTPSTTSADAGAASTSNTSASSTAADATTGQNNAASQTSPLPVVAMSLATIASSAENLAAENFATQMMQQFDSTQKGYISLADIQSAYANNPSLGDPAQAQAVMSQWDSNNDGQITQQELISGFEQHDIASQMLATYDPQNNGYIDLKALPAAVAQTSSSFVALLSSWDSTGNGQLTQAEIMKGLAASSMSLANVSDLMGVVNAAVGAQKMMAQYDSSGQGYANLSDINAALTSANPSAASSALATQAQNEMNFYDVNGDGQITLGELINGTQIFNVASQLMAQFDPLNSGYIDVSATGMAAMSAASGFAAVLKSWDSNQDGQLTQQEIVAGLQTSNLKFLVQSQAQAPSSATDPASQAAAIMAQFDSNYDGQISLSEFLNQATIDQSISSDPLTTFNAWDSNHDGYLSLDEIQTGIGTIQQAQTIIGQYDTAHKGYFDITDLTNALTAGDPTLSASAARTQAQQIMNFWDVNGDGQVSVQEVIAASSPTTPTTPSASAPSSPMA